MSGQADWRMSVAEARNRFSEIVVLAENGEPTVITRYGEPVAVLMPLPEDPIERERFIAKMNPALGYSDDEED